MVRWGRTIAVLVVLLGAHGGVAQPAAGTSLGWLAEPDAARLYLALRDGDGETMGLAGEAFAAASQALATALDVDAGELGSPCVALTGTGSNPRWDGGGGSLVRAGALPAELGLTAAIVDLAEVEDLSVLVWPSATRPLVVIDAFSLDVLLTALVMLGEIQQPVPVESVWHALLVVPSEVIGHAAPLELSVEHGHLVLARLLASLEPTGRVRDVRRVDSAHAVLTLGNGAVVHLVDVRFDDLTTIERAFQTVAGLADDPVVSMSWGFVDCAVDEAYARARLTDPAGAERHYVEFLVGQLELATTDTRHGAIDALCTVVHPDRFTWEALRDACDAPGDERLTLTPLLALPLLAYLDVEARRSYFDDLDRRSDVRFVAAAGNQGLAFPLPPASWDGVTGVASCQGGVGGTAVSPFSNAAGFPLHRPDEIAVGQGAFFAWPGRPFQVRDVGFYGTSFAAPDVALRLALDASSLVVPGDGVTGVGVAAPPCPPSAPGALP